VSERTTGTNGLQVPEWATFLKDQATQIDWVEAQIADLHARYAGWWIAVQQCRVLATGRTVEEASEAIGAPGAMLIFHIPEHLADWRPLNLDEGGADATEADSIP